LLESEIRLKGFDQPIVLREGWAGAQARQAIPAYLAVVSLHDVERVPPRDIDSVKIHPPTTTI